MYPAPTNEQVPSLKGLLEYIDARETGGTVNKYITNRRKHLTIQEGAVQQVRRELTVQAHRHEQLFVNELHTTLKRESHLHTHKPHLCTNEHHTHRKQVRRINRISLEIFSPVQVVKKITNVRVTRPIFIFTS